MAVLTATAGYIPSKTAPTWPFASLVTALRTEQRLYWDILLQVWLSLSLLSSLPSTELSQDSFSCPASHLVSSPRQSVSCSWNTSSQNSTLWPRTTMPIRAILLNSDLFKVPNGIFVWKGFSLWSPYSYLKTPRWVSKHRMDGDCQHSLFSMLTCISVLWTSV